MKTTTKILAEQITISVSSSKGIRRWISFLLGQFQYFSPRAFHCLMRFIFHLPDRESYALHKVQ